MSKRAIAAAHRLVNAGIKPGDRVAVVAETGADFMVVFFGCQYAGMVPCPLALFHVHWRPQELCDTALQACLKARMQRLW